MFTDVVKELIEHQYRFNRCEHDIIMKSQFNGRQYWAYPWEAWGEFLCKFFVITGHNEWEQIMIFNISIRSNTLVIQTCLFYLKDNVVLFFSNWTSFYLFIFLLQTLRSFTHPDKFGATRSRSGGAQPESQSTRIHTLGVNRGRKLAPSPKHLHSTMLSY